MPALYAAAWDLCRRGIIRPGISHYRGQATADGASGEGYSITPFGKQWLAEADKDDSGHAVVCCGGAIVLEPFGVGVIRPHDDGIVDLTYLGGPISASAMSMVKA